MASRPVFEIERLSFSYPETAVFDNFSASSSSNIVVLRGPSGCGKTTLLNLLLGFLKPNNVVRLPKAQKPAMIIQEDGLFPWLTSKGNLLLGGRVKWEDAIAHPLYPMVSELMERRVYTLSYGQRRKIELFAVLCRRHDLLCLDEPFNFIDPPSRATIAEHLKSGALSDGLVIITSHYEQDIVNLDCDIFELDGTLPVQSVKTYSYRSGVRSEQGGVG